MRHTVYSTLFESFEKLSFWWQRRTATSANKFAFCRHPRDLHHHHRRRLRHEVVGEDHDVLVVPTTTYVRTRRMRWEGSRDVESQSVLRRQQRVRPWFFAPPCRRSRHRRRGRCSCSRRRCYTSASCKRQWPPLWRCKRRRRVRRRRCQPCHDCDTKEEGCCYQCSQLWLRDGKNYKGRWGLLKDKWFVLVFSMRKISFHWRSKTQAFKQ